MTALNLSLVAADRLVWEGEARIVRARGSEGDVGILAGHTPMLSVLVSGEVHIEAEDGSKHDVSIDSGFLSVDHDRVTIVADNVDASSLHGANT